MGCKPTRVASWFRWATAVAAILVLGCRQEDPRPEPGASVPGATSAPPSVCDPTPLDAANELLRALPDRTASFCRDQHSRVRAIGGDSEADLAADCATLLAEECKDLVRHGVFQIVRQRYVEERGGGESMVVTGFRFGSVEGAYANHVERLLGVEHPSRLRAVPLGTRAPGAIVGARGSFVRGANGFEVEFVSERLTEAQQAEAGDPSIRAMASAIEAALPEGVALPESVRRLPEPERLPFGVQLIERDAFGVEGAGPGAFGYYARGERFYRLYVNQTGDEGVARDIERTLRRSPGHRRLEKMAFGAFELDVAERYGGGRWLVARLGPLLVGAGDDLFDVLREPSEIQERRRLSRLEKFRLVRDVLLSR